MTPLCLNRITPIELLLHTQQSYIRLFVWVILTFYDDFCLDVFRKSLPHWQPKVYIYQPNKMGRIYYLRPDLLVPSYFLAKVFLYITILKKCFEMPDIFTVYGNVLILLNDQKKM